MAVTCETKYKSLAITKGQSREQKYVIRGTADEAEALAILDTTAPLLVDTLARQSIEVEEEHVDETDADACIWTGTAQYGLPGAASQTPPSTGDSVFSFDTSGGTQHITVSRETVGAYGTNASVSDYGKAIGWEKGSIQGTDITVPIYTWAETHYLANSIVTSGYRGALFTLTGRTNNASFKGMAAGECLFMGASGTKRSSGEDWEINFRFASSPNRSGITIGSIANIEKKGWEYMWVFYKEKKHGTLKEFVPVPQRVYVERVYEDGDFSILGIGT